MTDRVAALEAILFVAEAPVLLKDLAEVLEVAEGDLLMTIEELRSRLAASGSGIEVRSVGGGWRLYTRPETYPYLERFASSAASRKLSGAALETLAVVAYKQPVSRSQVTEIRGVDADSAMRTLERLGLIVELRRLPLPGNPAVYGTTDLFLEKLGLDSLADLPPLADHVPPSDVVEAFEETFRTP